jgi:outer membrane receptor protein involved in Fe transport
MGADRIHFSCRRTRQGCLMAVSLGALVWASAAEAQTTAPAPASTQLAAADTAAPVDTAQDQVSTAKGTPAATEIIVTGSRIQRSGFQSPTPLTTISPQELKAKAIVNLGSLQADVPQFRPNQDNAFNAGPIGGAYLDLRGLGSNRTLILLDGRRLAPTSPNGGVDVSTIPAALISRVEIVTGGASAAYGSDAVSGVVNIFLDNNFTGLRAQAQYGQSQYDDNKESSFSAAYGAKFAGGRGHIMIAGEDYKNTGAENQGTRAWGNHNSCLLTNPNYVSSGANGAKNIISNNCNYSQMTNGGLIVAPVGSPLRGIQFGPGGTPEPYVYGNYAGGFYQQGGSGDNESYYANISPRLTRKTGFGRISFDITPDIQIYAEALYAHETGSYDLVSNYDNGTLTIQRDNAYLPASIKAIMLANNITSFKFGRTNFETGFEGNYKAQDDGRYAAGAKGSFGSGWTWDAFGQFSRNKYLATSPLNRIQQNWFNAVDAVVDPSSGQVVCRVKLTNPSSPCVPANVFGPGSISAASQAYFLGTSVSHQRQTQDLYAANLRGNPFSTWAGPVSIALGGEYRKETIEGTSDPISLARGWRSINQQPLSGSLNVKEAYLETVVPLLKDKPFVYNLELNAAGRITNYSSSGTVETWKVGLNYSPIQDLRLRGTISRDIRAPSINELFSSQNQVIGPIIDSSRNNSSQVLQLTGGNPNLKAEISKTITAGFVYEPSWLSGFHLSIDYYHIKIKDAITTPSAQTVADSCNAGQTIYCSFITRDSSGVITQILATLINAQSFKTDGVDFESVYRHQVGPGDLTLRALATYVAHVIVTTNNVSIDYASQVAGENGNGEPHWRGSVEADYRLAPFSITALVRLVGGGTYNSTYVTGVDINDNHVSGRTYLDLSGSYDLNEHLQLYAKINNVFNRAPPVTTNGLSLAQTATSPFYDVIGRFFLGGVRVKF